MLLHFSFIRGPEPIVIPSSEFHQHFRLKEGQIPSISGVKLFGPPNRNIQVAFDSKEAGRIPSDGVEAAPPQSWHNIINHVFLTGERHMVFRFSRIPLLRELIIMAQDAGTYNVTLDYTPIKGSLLPADRLQKLSDQNKMHNTPGPGETGHIMRQDLQMG